MNVSGKARLLKIKEDGKVLVGQLYWGNRVGEDQNGDPKWETDFVNAKFVGKAKQFLVDLPMDVEKMQVNVLSAKLRNRSYKDKNGNFATWTEVTVFEMEEVLDEPKTNTNKFNKFKK